MTDRSTPDRFLIEVQYGHNDWTYPYWDGFEIAESTDRAVTQILALADEVDALRVTKFNMDGCPARDVSEDLLYLAFLEWDSTHDNEHAVPDCLDAAYRQSNIMRMAG